MPISSKVSERKEQGKTCILPCIIGYEGDDGLFLVLYNESDCYDTKQGVVIYSENSRFSLGDKFSESERTVEGFLFKGTVSLSNS